MDMWKNNLLITQRDGRNIDEYDVYNKVIFISYLHNTAILKHFFNLYNLSGLRTGGLSSSAQLHGASFS
jgi:hypothetical protein